MKTVRSLLALSLSAALILLSPGSRAWAQAAEAATGAAAPSAGIGAVGGVHALPSSVGLTSLSAPALTPGLSAPSASLSAPALSGAPAAVSAAAAPTTAAAAPAAAAALSFNAAPAAEPASAVATAVPAQAPASTPAVLARPPSATSALNQASRALAASSALGSRSLALDRLFFGARRVLGLDSAPAVDASTLGAANASGLSPATTRAAAPAPIPAPRSAALPEIAPAAAHAVALGASILHPLVGLATVMVSMVLHEIGHAKVAAALGDPTAAREGRASFNPLKWGRHVDPMMTIVLPLATFFLGGFIFGGAKPVPVDSSYFKNPVRDMAKVAFAGPAVNLALAGAGALAYAGAVALGMGGAVLGALTTFIFINSLLALFNLIPVRPLDGGHILAALLPAAVSARLDAFYARFGALGLLPVIAIALLGGGFIVAAATALTHLLIGVSIAATGVQVASAALPAIAALGMALGTIGTPPTAPIPAAAAPRPGTETVVVMFDRTKPAAVTKDLHLAALDARRSDYALTYQRQYGALMADVSALGVAPQTLAAYNASPVASYRRINAATFTLDAGKAEEFAAMLRAQGHRVYPNERRKIILPVPFHPEASDPTSRNAISMAENLKITRADAVQAIARGLWGAPNMDPGASSSGLRRLFGAAQPAQPKVGVVDSGADTSHPLLKRVKQVQNFTTEPNTDDIGHGSWVTSMVLNYAPWLANLTHYKTFTNGGATLDDILKALTAAANDGNLVISNSWGSDDGDPESPDSKLVQQLAQEGHIMVFAGGNAGPGANTIGSPAIIQFKDPTTGAIRVVAVAATDRNKKVASFSSVGPGSPKTVGQTGFAHRPDLASDGVNTEGAWPQALGDADRTDPDAGPLKAISGTSMSTPTVAGAIVLLAMLFGVTEIGPKLDAIVVALLSTLQKTGKNDADHEGGGFMDVKAAYDALVRQFGAPSAPGFTARVLGLAPAPSYVEEYRALSRQVRDDAASEAAFRRDLNESGNSADVREELLAHLENYILPEHAARRERLAALIAAHPDAAYAAAGPLARAWLRLTGRGPRNRGNP